MNESEIKPKKINRSEGDIIKENSAGDTQKPDLGNTKSPYDFDELDHRLIRRFKPKYLGRGGEQIVYELSQHPEVVVKVLVESIKNIIEYNQSQNKAVGEKPIDIMESINAFLRQEKERINELKHYFGDHVPDQRQRLMKIPITEKILKLIYKKETPPANEVWAIVSIQQRVDELANADRLAIVGGYAEKNHPDEVIYRQVTDHLLFDSDNETSLNKEDFLQIQNNPNLKKLIEASENNSELKKVLKELVENTIRYTQETGEILDLAGEDNIVIAPKDGHWDYKLVDAKDPYKKGKSFEAAKQSVLRRILGQTQEGDDNIFLNVVNYVRTINGLAELTGSKEKIKLLPEGITVPDIDFLKMLSVFFKKDGL